jgi:hypothetical protein
VAPHKAAGAVLYSNDLSPRCSPGAFQAAASDSITAGAGPAGYLVLLKTGPGIEFGVGPDAAEYAGSKIPDDARMEVDAEKLTGPDKTFVGFECRVQLARGRPTGGYRLVVGSDGGYAIERFGGSPQTLASGGSAVTVAGTNHLMAECLGTRLALFVNGKEIARVQDGATPTGLIGIYARTLDRGPTEILFTNFVVTSP